MAVYREDRTECEPIQRLTKREIDRRIDALVTEVVAHALKDVEQDWIGSEPLRPRWISAAELVRRMRPFMVNN